MGRRAGEKCVVQTVGMVGVSAAQGTVPVESDPVAMAWDSIRAGLRRDCGARTFDNWLKPASLVGLDEEGVVCIALPSEFMANWVDTHYGERLLHAWRAHLPSVARVVVETGSGVAKPALFAVEAQAAAEDEAEPAEDGTVEGIQLEPRYTFETFVTGKPNEVAYNAARTVAEGGALTFNPLFLHGSTGLGKTHLMHAIGHEFRRRVPKAKIVYMSAEKFMFEFVGALRARDTHGFKQRLRSADLLMIDDVQFIAGKDSTQEEFFHTMNEIIGAGKRLVITADRSPQDLEGIESRILSRLSWGLVADVNPADFELRLNIISRKLETMPQAKVPQEVQLFLAKRIASNVRELEGALNRVVAYAMLSNRPIDIAFVEETLTDVLRAHQRRITIDEIQRKVSDHYRIRQSEMTSARRAREVARPRQIAMYLAKQLTPRSLPEIGRRFGGRDHTTVIHAVRKIEELRRSDAELDADVRLLLRQLEA
jgi:chromosomal replication initiator protein